MLLNLKIDVVLVTGAVCPLRNTGIDVSHICPQGLVNCTCHTADDPIVSLFLSAVWIIVVLHTCTHGEGQHVYARQKVTEAQKFCVLASKLLMSTCWPWANHLVGSHGSSWHFTKQKCVQVYFSRERSGIYQLELLIANNRSQLH